MKLSDTHIERKIAEGKIHIIPMPKTEAFGAFSVDLRLGNQFRHINQHETHCIDCADIDSLQRISRITTISDDEFYVLHPHDFVIGITRENIALPDNIAGRLDGRSKLARLGLMVHCTAHTVDPGWRGRLALELANIGRLPLILRPGMRICALSFEKLSGKTSKPYSKNACAAYGNQQTP